MVASPNRSPGPASPKPQLMTRYRCGFPGCNKRYASTDGVRKHARKTHMTWLKSVDENAGSRDRQVESKPSTYCVKEEGPFDDNLETDYETSPNLTPQMGSMSMGGPDLPMFSLPEAAAAAAGMNGGNASDLARGQMAAAAANLLAHGAPPQTLAWLLAQQAAMQQSLMQQAVAQQAARVAASGGFDASGAGGPSGGNPNPQANNAAAVAAAAAALGLGPMPMLPTLPPWMNLHDALPPAMSLSVPTGPLGGPPQPSHHNPLPVDPLAGSPNDVWSSDISALFASATGEEDEDSVCHADPRLHGSERLPARASGASPVSGGSSVAGSEAAGPGPLCLTPPTGSVLTSSCVSPFELEKRPQRPNTSPLPPEMGNGSMSKSASALHFGASIEKDLSEKGNVSEQDAFALKEEPGKESEYTAFVETLLAM